MEIPASHLRHMFVKCGDCRLTFGDRLADHHAYRSIFPGLIPFCLRPTDMSSQLGNGCSLSFCSFRVALYRLVKVKEF